MITPFYGNNAAVHKILICSNSWDYLFYIIQNCTHMHLQKISWFSYTAKVNRKTAELRVIRYRNFGNTGYQLSCQTEFAGKLGRQRQGQRAFKQLTFLAWNSWMEWLILYSGVFPLRRPRSKHDVVYNIIHVLERRQQLKRIGSCRLCSTWICRVKLIKKV